MIRSISHWAAGLALVLPSAALAQPPRGGAADLPIRRIVLFSSGVGYYQREGQIEGNSRVDLQFPAANINDLLKSLVLQDTGGGQISTITYDSRDPIDKTLKSFAIDLTTNISIGSLLQQVRGERIEVTLTTDGQARARRIAGIIVGTEKQRQPIGKDQIIDVELVNLLTDEGLRGVSLQQVEQIRFLKPELEAEFCKALEVLARAHDKQKKTVTLNLLGNNKRAVRVGYISESPIWKTTYRLSLGKDKASDKGFLQGWAIVENPTDEDWSQVSLGLVSGRPISFRMDLYEPLYVPRPLVEPELFASLRPQTYSGSMGKAMAGGQAGGMGGVEFGMPVLSKLAPSAPAQAPADARAERITSAPAKQLLADAPSRRFRGLATADGKARLGESLEFESSVASAAVANELGEYVEYHIEQPVSLGRQKSALLPIVNQEVELAKTSIYNEGVHAKYPLRGLRFKNTTTNHLVQGPLTVFEDNAYAGDARIPDLQPKESRLVSYAVDLGVEVAPELKDGTEVLSAVKVYQGNIESAYKLRQHKVYTVKNRADAARTILIEHPYRADWKLKTPEKAQEQTRDVYRFEVKVKPDETVVFNVVEEQTRATQVALVSAADEAITFILRAKEISPKVREKLGEAMERKAKMLAVQRQSQEEQQALAAIDKDQSRMRANMERVPQTSEAYKRYLKKFDDQETQLERIQDRLKTLQQAQERERKSYEEFVIGLSVE